MDSPFQIYDPPTTDSPSGWFDLSEIGHAFLDRIARRSSESFTNWFERLRTEVPQIVVGSSVTFKEIESLEKRLGRPVPQPIKDAWDIAPGIAIRSDIMLHHPSTILRDNLAAAGVVDGILETRIFVGGYDGHQYTIDLTDGYLDAWDRDTGFLDTRVRDIQSYLAEHISWYVTSMNPFCFDHGYVPRSAIQHSA